MESAAEWTAILLLPLYMGAAEAPLAAIAMYILVVTPLLSTAKEISHSSRGITLERALWHVPSIFARLLLLGGTAYALARYLILFPGYG